MARVYDRYIIQAEADIQASYRQAETEAWEPQRGLWSEPGPVEPWLYRRAARQMKSHLVGGAL
jgi:endonuclease YncB( thermonuclease family)